MNVLTKQKRYASRKLMQGTTRRVKRDNVVNLRKNLTFPNPALGQFE